MTTFKFYFAPLLALLFVVSASAPVVASPDATPTTTESRRFETFKKRINKTFPLNADGIVGVNTKYGEVRVETWDRSEVSFEVTISAVARNQEEADETFGRVGIDFSDTRSRVTATTSFTNKVKTSFFGLVVTSTGIGNDVKVNYLVKMPRGASFDTDSRYCDIYLPNLRSNNRLSLKYGDLVTGSMTGSNTIYIGYGKLRTEVLGTDSEIELRYSEATIKSAGDLKYDGRYSEIQFGEVDEIEIEAAYDEIEIQKATRIDLEGNYNEVQIGTVATLIIDGNYGDFEVERVTKTLEIEARYGDLEVESLAAGFDRVEVDAAYIDISIDIEAGAGYRVDLSTRYADIEMADRSKLQNMQSEKDGSTQTLKGAVNGTGQGLIKITTSYGDIELR